MIFFRGDQYRYKISPDQVKDRITAMEDYLRSIAETPPAGTGLPLINKLKIPWLFTDLSFKRNDVYVRFSFLFMLLIFFLFIFKLFPLFAEKGRNLEERINNENHWPQLLHVSGIECHIERFVCFAAYFSSFSKRKCISKSWGKLMNCKP